MRTYTCNRTSCSACSCVTPCLMKEPSMSFCSTALGPKRDATVRFATLSTGGHISQSKLILHILVSSTSKGGQKEHHIPHQIPQPTPIIRLRHNILPHARPTQKPLQRGHRTDPLEHGRQVL